METWSRSWTKTALKEWWRTQFYLILPVTGEAATGKSSSWELISVCMTNLIEWALAFTTTGPFMSSEDARTEVGSNWWGYSVCWCSCGTQDNFAWKLIWKNESLATSIQQMTLTVLEQHRVHKQIRRSRAAPSPAEQPLLILDEILSAYGLISYSFVSSGWGHTNPCQQHGFRMPAEGLSCWGSTWEDLF